MLTTMLQAVVNGLAALLSVVVQALPGSPFQGLTALTIDNKWIGYLAYVVPVGAIVSTLEAWLVCIGVYYLYSVVMRWIKVVGD